MVIISEQSSMSMLNAIEAERLIEELRPTDIKDIGSKRWTQQKETLEQLNVQAHHNAMSNRDEFVTELFISLQKFPVLIHELITIEIWKSKVLPLVHHEMVNASTSSLKPYNLMYYEAIIANLLECMFYSKDAVLSCDEVMIDLVDYCCRKINYLNTLPEDRRGETDPKDVKMQLIEQTDADRLDEQRRDIEFNCAMFALSILRYITDNIAEIPPGVITRMHDTHDIIVSLVYLIERAPWRRRGRQAYQKFINGSWTTVPNHELSRVTQNEAQVWLTLNTLLVDGESRNKYEINTFRKDTIIKIKRYLTELLIDQIIVLSDLHRVIEELQIMNPPEPTYKSSILFVEQVPIIFQQTMSDVDWEAVAQNQVRTLFEEDEESKREEIMRLSKLFEQFTDLLGNSADVENIDLLST